MHVKWYICMTYNSRIDLVDLFELYSSIVFQYTILDMLMLYLYNVNGDCLLTENIVTKAVQ